MSRAVLASCMTRPLQAALNAQPRGPQLGTASGRHQAPGGRKAPAVASKLLAHRCHCGVRRLKNRGIVASFEQGIARNVIEGSVAGLDAASSPGRSPRQVPPAS